MFNRQRKIRATISAEGEDLGEAVCEFEMPIRATDRVELRFSSYEDRVICAVPFQFSVKSVRLDDGEGLSLRADTVYRTRAVDRTWSPNLNEYTLVGEARDLTLIHQRAVSPPYRLSFWLTPNICLRPWYLRGVSYDGSATVDNLQCQKFTLENGVELRFLDYFRYVDQGSRETLSFTELVAEAEIGADAAQLNVTVELLDEFLLLTSFASRQRTICVGWDGTLPEGVIQYFRHTLTIPEASTDHSFNDTLIDTQKFQDFMARAYPWLCAHPKRAMIRDGLARVTFDDRAALEKSYMSLHSVVELLLNIFAAENPASNRILEKKEWGMLAADLRSVIEGCQSLGDSQRVLLRSKLGELNRVPLRTVVERFTKHFRLDFSDLWPFWNEDKRLGLSALRNHLIHGYPIGRAEGQWLMVAHFHLECAVERMLLGMMGWPVGESRVHYDAATMYGPQLDWRNAQSNLTAAWR